MIEIVARCLICNPKRFWSNNHEMCPVWRKCSHVAWEYYLKHLEGILLRTKRSAHSSKGLFRERNPAIIQLNVTHQSQPTNCNWELCTFFFYFSTIYSRQSKMSSSSEPKIYSCGNFFSLTQSYLRYKITHYTTGSSEVSSTKSLHFRIFLKEYYLQYLGQTSTNEHILWKNLLRLLLGLRSLCPMKSMNRPLREDPEPRYL